MQRTDTSRYWPPAAGLLAASAGLAFGELGGAIASGAGPVVVVGDAVVDRVPSSVKNWAIEVFGKNDKAALIIGVLVIVALSALFLGRVASRRFSQAVAGVAGFSVIGVAAALSGRSPTPRDLVGVASALVVTVFTLWVLVGRPGRPGHRGPTPWSPTTALSTAALSTTASLTQSKPESMTALPRRNFLVLGGGSAVAAAAAFGSSRVLVDDAATRTAQPIPEGVRRLPVKRASTEVDIDSMPPWLTATDDFYRIDTALIIPRIDATTWKLNVVGRVDTPLAITYDALRNETYGPLVEHDCTLMCVSNEIGGELVGNARWTGVRLRDILKRAGVQEGVDQLFLTSIDGFTAGFPVSVAQDEREALLVIGMNGEPLRARHGFPARLVVPGIYGYVSAVKWITEMKLTTFEEDTGYWIPRGWSQLAPVKTCSRIDVVGTGGRISSTVTAGTVAIGGVAWAQHTGIAAVEVQIDDEPWSPATLAGDGGIDTWRQWKFLWSATPGKHRVRVRATDASGFTQRGEPVAVAPDGAEGWHTVRVRVEEA